MSGSIVHLIVFISVAVVMTVILREVKNEYVLPLTVVSVVFVFVQVLPMIKDIIGFSEDLTQNVLADSSVTLLYKAMGTSLLVQYVSEFSRENGLESLASKSELVGKLYITLLCLPLISEILSAVSIN